MDLDLIVNPFENDIAIDPRRIEKPVPGLNDRALDKLLAAFNQLTREEHMDAKRSATTPA